MKNSLINILIFKSNGNKQSFKFDDLRNYTYIYVHVYILKGTRRGKCFSILSTICSRNHYYVERYP